MSTRHNTAINAAAWFYSQPGFHQHTAPEQPKPASKLMTVEQWDGTKWVTRVFIPTPEPPRPVIVNEHGEPVCFADTLEAQ